MAKKVIGIQELLVEELQDLLDVEKQLVRAIPKMAKAASDEELGNALKEHLEVTKGQVQRLEKVFEAMDIRLKSRPCKGMKGIIDEGKEMLEEELDETALDTAISSSARKVEHYEMMGYETAAALAKQLGRTDVEQMLRETLQEEMQADKTLAQLAKRLIKSSPAPSGATEAPARRGGKAAVAAGNSSDWPEE